MRLAGDHSAEAGRHSAIAFARMFIGVFWLYEVTVGHNWKTGWFGTGYHPGWLGPGAGDQIREDVALAVEDGTWTPFAWFLDNLIVPNAELFSYLVIVLQIGFGLFLLFGFAVRPTALVALAFDLSVFMLGNSRIPPFFSAAHLFVLYTNAGMYHGLDGVLVPRLRRASSRVAQIARRLLERPWPRLPQGSTIVIALASLSAVYFFMQILMRPTPRMGMVAMDLAILSGFIAAGAYFAYRGDRVATAAALLRIFIGYKLLHEVWVRIEPGVNALPGWAPVDAQEAVWVSIAESHWAPAAALINGPILGAPAFWVGLFAVVQTAVAVALLLGWRTRFAAAVGLFYLGALILLGFNRYAPFVFGLLVVVYALDAGRRFGIDSARLRARPPRYGLPIRPRWVLPMAVFAAAVAVAAVIGAALGGGAVPDGYATDVGQVTAAVIVLLAGLFALVGWFQWREPRHPVAASATIEAEAGEPAEQAEAAGTPEPAGAEPEKPQSL